MACGGSDSDAVPLEDSGSVTAGVADESTRQEATSSQDGSTVGLVNASADQAVPSADVSPSSSTVRLSGRVTYDRVPHTDAGALNYSDIQIKPSRGVVVELLNADGAVIRTTVTDADGRYQLSVEMNSGVRVRVKAHLLQQGAPGWDYRVVDNTQNNALYVMDGALNSTGTVDSQRDLHAPSGWDGNDYSRDRVAAPFAIIDSIYDAKTLALSAKPTLVLPALEVRWSTENRAVDGDRRLGEIATSYYDTTQSIIYLLGYANNDTDEYDESVIQHEWTHYLEATLARTDSRGGYHQVNHELDIRLAFSEGLANTFASMISGNSRYQDAFGNRQRSGLLIGLEESIVDNHGFFSENSVGLLLYDAFDDNNEVGDNLTLGFGPFLDVLTDANYKNSQAFTSLYLFLDNLAARVSETQQAEINHLKHRENIFGDGIFGEGEQYSGELSDVILPVYRQIDVGDNLAVCSSNNNQSVTDISVNRFVRFNNPDLATYTIQLDVLPEPETTFSTDPDLALYLRGNIVSVLESTVAGFESATLTLPVGEYIFDIYDFNNASNSQLGGLACFNLSIVKR